MQLLLRARSDAISPRSRFLQLRRGVLAGSILATATLALFVASSLVRFATEGWWLAVLLALPLGVATIDLVTGIVHWACDRFGDATTPVVGPLLIRAFREHHVDPSQMVDHDWIETNGEPCVFTAPTLAVLALLAPSVQSGPAAAALTVVWTMATLGACANQVHKWAHMPRAPWMARFLQRVGLALRPSEHACHHQSPYDSGYCISTGWMNPLLDRLGLWARLERLLRRTA
ncbi:MAG: fatty acid desaturase family protein [Myxococcales bacterium]|nr:fatty acid desaturase family protein [Myxococcales bacterium]